MYLKKEIAAGKIPQQVPIKYIINLETKNIEQKYSLHSEQNSRIYLIKVLQIY